MLGPAFLLLVGCLFFSYLPGVTSGAVGWSHVFQDRTAFSNAVLHDASETAVRVVGELKPTVDSYIYAIVSLLLTAVVFGLSLFPGIIPRKLRRGCEYWSGPIVKGLQYCHSGYVGDYVVWQVIGFVMIGFALAVAAQ
jgi:hypothetical protein